MYRLERGGTKMATSLRLFAFITITIFGLSLAQECAVNQCPGGETCFDRNVDAQPSFVCECDAPTEMGYNCLTPTADIDEIFTCYGSGCETGSFSSPGWPTEVYSSRYGGLYLLYIPGAQRIDFTFNSPFAIESLKDELYVGPGLSFTQSQLDGLTVPNDHYFFEGSNIPAGFSIESDTVWMAFLTDKNVQLTGFQIQWSSFGDETRPIISNCPSNIQTTIPLGTAQTSIQWIEPTAVDDSGVANIILQTSTPGSNFGVGPTTVTYVFADPTGNTAICSFTVTVIAVDNEKPTITGCPNNIFREIELGTPSTTVVWTEPTAVDNSGSVTLTLRSHSPGSAFAVGSTVVTYEFTDPSSNVEICSFTVTVVTDDTVPPTISNCPSSTFQNIDIGTGGASVVWVEPTATDLSGSVTVTSNRSPGSFFLGGTTTNVEYVFTDPSGNEAICSFSVTIEEVDNQQPTISGCPANINVNVELGTTSATVTWIEPTAVDNSGVVNLITRSHAPNSEFLLGTTPVSYVFSDLSNNIAQCGFDVTVTPVDNTPPTVLNCPVNILRTVELGVSSLPVSWVEPSATDISGVVSLASRSHAPGDSFPIGPTVVSYVFLDSSSNDAPCAFTVTITTEDTTPPVISDCPVGVVRVVELGTPGAVASWTEPTATDLSGAVTLTQRSHQPNDFFGIGATVVSYTFLDNSGNDASCSFTVNIVMQDTTPPTIDNCPTSFSSITELGTGGTIVNWVEPTATDLSNVANLILRSHEPGTFFTVGTTTVTYRFSDADSNLATCMFDVTVIADDTVPPTIVNCPTGILINVELGETSSQAFWTEPSATDLSGQANLVTRTNQPGDNFPLGPTVVTYVFRDNSGNSDQCQFTVTVGTSDNTPPTIANCPTNIDRTVELGSSGLPVSWLEPTATDLSGVVTLSVRSNAPGSTFNLGTTIVNYIFIDSSSNEAMCTFSVTVVPVDTTRPTISNCPANIAEVIEVGTTSAFVSWIEPTATDASGQVFTSRSEAPGNLFPVGPTPVTYTFTDNSNNFAECEFVVTVIQTDTLPPTLQSCPTDLSAITELGTSGTVVVWTEPIATDISGVANLVFQSHQSGNLFVVGETDVIYTFADNTGNSVDCEFTVTVTTEDTQRPTIANCPTNIETTVELGSSGAVANWIEPTATDISGTATLVLRTAEPGSSFSLGDTTVNYIFRDASGNNAICSFSVIVNSVDTTPPAIENCPSNIDVTVELGTPSTPVNWIEPTATDLSGTVTLSQRSHSPGSTFPVGMTVVSYTFTDAGGISAMCSFVVNVIPVDRTPPTISNCPTNIGAVVELGTTSANVQWQEPTATDASNQVSLLIRSHAPGSSFLVGSTTVTYRFGDNANNINDCIFDVIVTTEDTTPPIIQNCPANINSIVELGTPGRLVSWTEPTAFDASGVVNIVLQSHTTNSLFPVGPTIVTYVFSDDSGLTSTCTFTVTIITTDNTPPVISNCPDNILLNIELGITSAIAFWVEPTATDLSGVANIVTQSASPGDAFSLGTTIVNYVFSDGFNSDSCAFNVVVTPVDTQPPVIANCPAPISVVIELGSTGGVAFWTEPTATDFSGTVTLIERTNSPGSVFSIGTTVVRYTFSDNGGNEDFCTFPVTVTTEDTQDPIISNCPANIPVTIELGITQGVASWTEPTATDISGTANLVQRTSSPNSLFPIGSTDVTYTFSDNAGNTAECIFTVTVTTVDTTPPIIQNSPPDISRVVEFGVSGIPVSWIEPTAFDLSGVANLVLRSHEPGSVFPVGTTVVTYTFSDASGNPSQTEFTVTVTTEDTVPPTIQNCPSNIGLVVELGITSTSAFWLEPTATDLSGTVNLVTRSHTPGSSFPLGTTGVTYTFTDASNNPSTCSFNVVVSVEDTTPPVVSNCPAPIPITVELGSTEASAQWQEPTATDLSGIVSLAQRSHAPGSSFPLGTTVVTYRFIDNAGNDVVCSFAVTVTPSDTQDPIISNCPANIAVTIELGTTRGVASWTEPTATDISGTTNLVQRTSSPNSLFPIGSTDVTYIFSDNSGNTAECIFIVTVTTVDTTPPTIIQCPSDITAEAIINTGGVIVTWVTPTAVDISGTANIVSQTALSGSLFQVGTTVVRITFVDASGNPADCVFDVIVTEVDPNPPEIFNCPEDITRIIELNEGGVEVFYSPPQATDDSGIVNLVSQSHTPGQFFPTGETIVVYLFSDPTGNNDECRFKVTVTEVDSIIPVIGILPEDITRTVQLGSPGTVVTWPEPQVSDNSGIVNLVSQSHTSGSFFPVGTTEVTYTYADPSNNRVMVSFDVNVIEVDSLIPVIGFSPEDITRTVPIGSPGTVVTWPEPQVSDNSGIVNLVSQSHTSGSFFPVGTTEVTYTYADPSNNRVMVSFDVNVIEVDPCDSGPCQNGAACVVTSTTEFICVCAGNCFTGVFCEIGLSACSSNQCANGAACLPVADSCTQYTCECPACFTGPFCNIELDACVNNQCQNGGQCVQENSCTTYRCECPPCFTGEFCEQGYNACDDNACLNGGVCSNIGGSCSEYTCSCPSCVTGAFCQFSRDSCNPNPCQNNGFCTSSADSSCFAYSCQCIGCFTGFNCEVAIPSGCSTNPCQNGGICSELPGTCGGYSCTCQNSFAGVRCQDPSPINVNPCNSSPCGNGATCLTMDGQYYICVCRPGYFGINCRDLDQGVPNLADPCDVGPCLNGATCRASYNANSSPLGQYVSQYTCICAPGFTGANCQAPTDGLGAALDICNLNTRPGCENGGTCANAYHSFDQDVDYFCFCLSGFTGHNCEATVPDPCASSPCQNNAACTSFSTYYTCSCAFGFSGTTCEIISSGDVTGPTISNCPSNIQVSVPVGSQGVATWPEPFAVDTTGVAELVYQSDTSGSSFPIGTSAVAYVFVDIYRNPSVCLFFVTVTSVQPGDNTPPVITGCPGDVTAFVPADANSAVVTWTEPTATDNSQVQLSLTQSHFPGSQFPLGTTPVSYTFTDASGNLATCSFNVIVTFEFADNVDPVVSNCPSDIVVNIPGGMFGRASWTAPTATDDSGTVTLVSGPAVTTGFFQLGSTPLMYVFEDEAGNQAICSFNVIVTTGTVDNIDPVISNCPQDVVVTANTGASSAPAFWNAPTAMDASGMVTLHSVSASPGDSFPLGSTPVTYIFSDAFGNTAECSFNVIVNAGGSDTTPPTILNCPSSQTITATAGASSAVATWIVPTATDASGIAGVTSSANPGDSFPLGPNVVSYRFTDNANIDAVCEFQILVLSGGGGDLTAPVISNCPANIQQNLPNGQFAAVSWTAPTAVDESGDVTVVGPGVPSAFFAIGVTTISYIFTDAAGNEAICSFDIIITGGSGDTTAPTILNCPSSQTITATAGASSAVATWIVPTATDASGIAGVTSSANPGDSFPLGPNVVSYRFTDNANLDAVCEFEILVLSATVVDDTTRPVISNCPTDIFRQIPNGAAGDFVSWSEPTATDNLDTSLTIERSHVPGAFFIVGPTLVSYTFTDDAGNSALCSFSVNIFVSGVVVDNTAPVISDCPVSPIEVTISSALDAGLVTWTPEPTAVDESTVTLTQSHLNGAEFPVGDTSVVYSFEDEFGNQANCSFTVTVTRGPNACSGNPCPENTSCFYSQDQFLCLPRSSRRRRDLLSDDAVCPCQNNGTCHHSGEGNYCKCPKGFSGVLCDAVEITMQKEAKPSYSEANLQWSMVTVMGILLLVITVLAFALCTMSNKIMAVSAKQQPDEVAIIH